MGLLYKPIHFLKYLEMKKVSKYNRYIVVDNELYVYNLLSRSLICLGDAELEKKLKNNIFSDFDEASLGVLEKNKFICDGAIDEYLQIIRLQRIIKYGNKNARLTILPTLNCNFRCWYCYEEHTAKNLSEKECKILLNFADNLLNNNHLNSLTLDWFGGEPMLRFKDIIVPLSLEIKQLCDEKGVVFYNMITTNGALISERQIAEMSHIELKKFQITLDGGKEFHNKTRFSRKFPNSYDCIVNNISMLVKCLPNIDLTLRINCTPTNIESIPSIIDSFSYEIRNKIQVNLQPIWQEVESLKKFSKRVTEITNSFYEAGFSVPSFTTLPTTPNICYVENMLHYTITPGLEVYKCTARDFKKDSINYIGNITEDGKFVSNDNILRYYCDSFFENDKCKECEVLPVCRGNCIQKCVERNRLDCQKEDLIKGVDSIIFGIIKRMKS